VILCGKRLIAASSPNRLGDSLPWNALCFHTMATTRHVMSAQSFTTLVIGPLMGWMASVSIAIVGYLFWLEIKEFRRNRRMQAQRKRLGLHHA
jgi:hypothetical protein